VDLDGTLVRTDTLIESLLLLLKARPLLILVMPLWALKGKSYFKQQIADRIELDPELLPYHQKFLAFLREEHQQGRRLVLATAANAKIADAVAGHLQLFDQVLASRRDDNLSGKRKLRRMVELYGEQGFDYAGNGRIDLEVWPHARKVLVVTPERGVAEAVRKQAWDSQFFDNDDGPTLRDYLKAARIRQWLKNLLVFIPLILAHQVTEPELLAKAVTAFLAFGLCASSVYLLNDLLDLQSDRLHPSKRRRPFASGRVPLMWGIAAAPILLLAGAALALTVSLEFLGVLAGYYLITLAYSLRLKRAAIIDVLVLASLYTLRIAAGAIAVNTTVSFWLLAFSMFIFLSLALAKRYSELVLLISEGRTDVSGRGYRACDAESIFQFGTTSAYMAVMVMALYINSPEVRDLYTHPQVIWLLCPLLLYLLSRVWLLARRQELDEDPLVFALEDRRSQWIRILGLIILWGAI